MPSNNKTPLPPMWKEWDKEAKELNAHKEQREVKFEKTDTSRFKFKDGVIQCGLTGWQGPSIARLLEELQKT